MAETLQDRLPFFQPPDIQPLSTPDRLSENYLEAIKDRYEGGFRVVRFLPNINLIRQGDFGEHDDFLFVILNGTIAIIQQRDDDTEREITRLGGAGALTGEIRALNPVIPRTRTVRAVTEVEAIRLFSSDIAGWNGAPKPWGDMHAFLTDLARQRYDTIDLQERIRLGIDARSLLKGITPRADQILQPVIPDQPPPVSVWDAKIAAIRRRTQEQKNP